MTEERIEIDRIMGRVSEQAELAAQILAALEGKASGGGAGGLPVGVTALASGTITPASNTPILQVTHNLDIVPNFGVCVIEENVYNTPLTSTCVGCASYMKNATSTFDMTVMFSGYDADDSYRVYSAQSVPDSSVVSDTKYVFINDRFPFRSGYAYRWVCGVMNGIQ